MKVDDDVNKIINKINSGEYLKYAEALDGSDFGIYIPSYVDKNLVKLLDQGYSQNESNLRITIVPSGSIESSGAKSVAWIGEQFREGKDSKCKHGKGRSCKHCTTHNAACKHCSHADAFVGSIDAPSEPLEHAPQLDYDVAVSTLDDKQEILRILSKDNIGLALLHGHSNQYEFTKLPPEYVAVVFDEFTQFKKIEEVENDPNFVPNMWRFIDGNLKIAGGYSHS